MTLDTAVAVGSAVAGIGALSALTLGDVLDGYSRLVMRAPCALEAAGELRKDLSRHLEGTQKDW